jgi:hypothetical protein
MPADTQYDVVHHLTIGGERYGCHSRGAMAKHYWAPHRVFMPDGSFRTVPVRVPVATSKACRSFYLWDADPKCAGCTAAKDHEYAERMKGMS